jgi:phosphoesterase RecJ-like protein
MNDRDRVLTHLSTGQRFIVSSHQRPDGDAVGSAMAMALALRGLGKQADVVVDAPLPHFLQPFPHTGDIRIATAIGERYDAALIMECSSLDRTGVAGLDRSPVINIDHHVGNTGYGAVNWVDESAAACGELVFTLIEALGAPLTPAVATHIYLAILTDTGSFHFSHLTPRTYEIAKRCVEAGADPQWIARTHYDSSTLARVRIFGAVLNGMQLDPSGRVAMLAVTRDTLASTGGSYDDTDGIINFPLSVKDIQAVAFFKEVADRDWRISLRSKGRVDVGAIARQHGGGGHANAAGCSARGELAALQATFQQLLVWKTDEATEAQSTQRRPGDEQQEQNEGT